MPKFAYYFFSLILTMSKPHIKRKLEPTLNTWDPKRIITFMSIHFTRKGGYISLFTSWRMGVGDLQSYKSKEPHFRRK